MAHERPLTWKPCISIVPRPPISAWKTANYQNGGWSLFKTEICKTSNIGFNHHITQLHLQQISKTTIFAKTREAIIMHGML